MEPFIEKTCSPNGKGLTEIRFANFKNGFHGSTAGALVLGAFFAMFLTFLCKVDVNLGPLNSLYQINAFLCAMVVFVVVTTFHYLLVKKGQNNPSLKETGILYGNEGHNIIIREYAMNIDSVCDIRNINYIKIYKTSIKYKDKGCWINLEMSVNGVNGRDIENNSHIEFMIPTTSFSFRGSHFVVPFLEMMNAVLKLRPDMEVKETENSILIIAQDVQANNANL